LRVRELDLSSIRFTKGRDPATTRGKRCKSQLLLGLAQKLIISEEKGDDPYRECGQLGGEAFRRENPGGEAPFIIKENRGLP